MDSRLGRAYAGFRAERRLITALCAAPRTAARPARSTHLYGGVTVALDGSPRPQRVARIVMTCREPACGASKEYLPGHIRRLMKRQQQLGTRDRASVDWESNRGSYLCDTCVHARRRVTPVQKRCRVCRKPLPPLSPSQARRRKTCSRRCAASARQRLKPWNDVQELLFDRMAELGQDLSGLAREAGVSPGALKRWIRREGGTTSRGNLERLAGVLGIPAEEAVELAGGRTAEDQRLAAGRAVQARLPAPGTPERRENAIKGARATKGVQQSDEARGRRRAAWEALDDDQQAARLAELAEATRSAKARAVHRLFGYLRYAPKPSAEQLHGWEERAAAALGIPVVTVRYYWRPHLRKRGAAAIGGRPRVTGRLELLLTLMAELGVDPANDIPTWFWEKGLERIQAHERRPPQSEETIRRWWQARKQ